MKSKVEHLSRCGAEPGIEYQVKAGINRSVARRMIVDADDRQTWIILDRALQSCS